ncbi:7010_t:CDS:2, partial [Funneliformis geosporum]
MSSIYVGEIPFLSFIWLENDRFSLKVKVSSFIIKAEEIADVSNATIVDRETAEFLENKSKKTLEEMRSLDWHHIADDYEMSP